MEDHSPFARIEDYLFNRMSEEDKAEFEREMARDEELRNEVEATREVLRAERLKARTEEKERLLSMIRSEDARAHKRTRLLAFSLMGAAAAVIALLFILNQQGSYLNQYFSPRPELNSMAPTAPDLLKQGMNAYKNGEFADCITSFAQIPDTSSEYNTALIYSANAHLKLGEVDQAQAQLLRLEAMDDTQYADDRRWLLGLIFLDRGEEDRGKSYLQDLYDDPGTTYHQSDIKEILGL